jgi:hypothetical protein
MSAIVQIAQGIRLTLLVGCKDSSSQVHTRCTTGHGQTARATTPLRRLSIRHNLSLESIQSHNHRNGDSGDRGEA